MQFDFAPFHDWEINMLAIKKARKLIEAKPTDEASVALADLVLALETEQSYPLHRLYDLDYKRFELAMEILAEWRLDRYYASKIKLIDASNQAREMLTAQSAMAATAAEKAADAATDNTTTPATEPQMPGI
jgi:hypothetical protein